VSKKEKTLVTQKANPRGQPCRVKEEIDMANARSAPHTTRRQFLVTTSALALPGWLAACAPQKYADVVLLGGEIHTVDADDRRVDALAISDGRVMAIGSNTEIERLIGTATRRVDLGGRTVLPGINDSHLHLSGWGLSQPPFSLDLTYPTVKSIADCVAAVRQAAETRPAGEWITGRGWDQPYFSEGRAPTAADLDAVAPDHPVALTEFSGHAVWANSKALELAGIGVDTQPPTGGVIVRDESGQPTGLLFEGASWMVMAEIPAPSIERRKAALRTAMQSMLERGITSYTEPGTSPEGLAMLNELASEPFAEKLRVTGLVRAGNSVERLRGALAGRADLVAADTMWMQMPGVKIMGDGIPTGNKTAWLHEPYESGGNGSLLIDGATDHERVAELQEMIETVHAAGLQIGTHVTGDRSIDTVVAAYRKVQAEGTRPDPRHYVIHADLVPRTTLAQMAESGIGANFNPEIKYLIADSQVASLGSLRASYEWPYKTALDAGVNVASSSDAPVTPGNWLQGIATCMDRRGKQSDKVSGPEQRISLDQAIRTYTWSGAWQDRAEHYKGSIEPGKVADLCVLDERLSSVTTDKFAETQTAMTIVDGKVVHETAF